jgi:hypothetical protein
MLMLFLNDDLILMLVIVLMYAPRACVILFASMVVEMNRMNHSRGFEESARQQGGHKR